MYGFTGYATNKYGTDHNRFEPPVVSFPMTILMLNFKGITIQL